jgi:alkanesulfonate monooxygenase SsuD/methylene tetrahydromethanopterin reductase-like flavin-dependent oxidoreductase (luciferase family)
MVFDLKYSTGKASSSIVATSTFGRGPLQQPTPPVWMTGLSVDTGRMAAERGHVVGTLLSGSAAG